MSKENNRLIDAVIDLGLEMKAMRKAQEETNKRLEHIEKHLEHIDKRLEYLEREQRKTNLLLAEHSRSIIALANKLEQVYEYEKRISKLESTVFH